MTPEEIKASYPHYPQGWVEPYAEMPDWITALTPECESGPDPRKGHEEYTRPSSQLIGTWYGFNLRHALGQSRLEAGEAKQELSEERYDRIAAEDILKEVFTSLGGDLNTTQDLHADVLMLANTTHRRAMLSTIRALKMRGSTLIYSGDVIEYLEEQYNETQEAHREINSYVWPEETDCGPEGTEDTTHENSV